MTASAHPKIRIGILGLGMAGGMLVPYIARHNGTTVAGAADINPELRARFRRDYDVEVSDSAEALLRRQDIDAVYIATPHQFHRQHALLAAQNGKHLIVEKPMALSLADCDAMIEAAERNRVTMIVGHTHSFDPAVRKIRELAATGSLGKLAMIAMWNYTDFMYRPRRPEELDTSKGGGILFNQVPHQVDVARLLANSPVKSVRANAAALDPRRPTEGCCMAFLEFESGAAATMVYSGYDHFDSDELHSWVSSTGRPKTPAHGAARKVLAGIKDEADEVRLRSERYGYGGGARFLAGEREHQPHFGSLIATYEHADLRPSADGVFVYADDGVHEIPLPRDSDGRTSLLDELCDAVAHVAPAVHDGRFARETVATCLAIRESAQKRREVVLLPMEN